MTTNLNLVWILEHPIQWPLISSEYILNYVVDKIHPCLSPFDVGKSSDINFSSLIWPFNFLCIKLFGLYIRKVCYQQNLHLFKWNIVFIVQFFFFVVFHLPFIPNIGFWIYTEKCINGYLTKCFCQINEYEVCFQISSYPFFFFLWDKYVVCTRWTST